MSDWPFPSIDSGTIELAISCLWLVVVAWLILRAFRQRGLLRPVGRAPPPPARAAPKVAIVVPARDEEANIGACLRDLLAQDYPSSHLRVLVADDHSEDATATIAQAIARDHPGVAVIQTPVLPPHWIGKSHACWIAAREAPDDVEWLCFVDADVRFERAALSSAVAAATIRGLDLLSLAPRQQLESFAERLVMPCGLYLLAFSQDLRAVQSPKSRDATATGQFMLIRRAAYDAVGGHAAIRGDICEDVALARLIKRAGGRVILYDGGALISTRMYTGWRTMWPGLAKNLVDMLNGPASAIAMAAAAVTLSWAAWLIPLGAAVSCTRDAPHGCLALLPALTGSAAAFALHLVGTSFFRIPLWYGLLFPIGYTAGALMALDSVRRRWRGRVTWKGRTYP